MDRSIRPLAQNAINTLIRRWVTHNRVDYARVALQDSLPAIVSRWRYQHETAGDLFISHLNALDQMVDRLLKANLPPIAIRFTLQYAVPFAAGLVESELYRTFPDALKFVEDLIRKLAAEERLSWELLEKSQFQSVLLLHEVYSQSHWGSTDYHIEVTQHTGLPEWQRRKVYGLEPELKDLPEIVQVVRAISGKAGLEEGAGVSRRGFLKAAAAVAATAVGGEERRHLIGLFVDGDPDRLADDAASRVANVDLGRKETVLHKLEPKSGDATTASLPSITRIFVQRDAKIPSVWSNIPVSWLDGDAAKAQEELIQRGAQPGEIVLIRPVDNETSRSWDQYLLSRQLLGVQATTEIAGLIDKLSKEGQLAILLGSLGEKGGLILWASIDERTSGERYLVVHA